MARASAKAPRGDYALPEKKAYPLNTPGRRQVAVKDAVASERAGNATPAEVSKVRKAVAAKSGKTMKCPKCTMSKGPGRCPHCGAM